MKRKKVTCLFMSLLASICLFANGGAETQKGMENVAPARQKNATINVWYKDTGVKGALYKKYIEQFEATHPGVTVQISQMRNDAYKEKLPISFSGDNQPDLFTTWGGSWLKSFIDAGHVMDITDKVDTTPYLETSLTNVNFDGKLYGLPLGVDIGIVIYNKALFEKFGLTPPKTFGELVHVCDVLKQNDIIPFVLANQPKWPASFYYMYLVDRIGGPEVFQNAYQGSGSWEDPAFIQAGEKIQQLVKNEYFNPGFNGIAYDSGPGRQLLYTEKCAMLLLSNTFVNLMRSEYPTFESKMDIFPFPAVEGGKGDPSDIVGIAAPVWSINAHTKYPDLCIELASLLAGKDIAQEYANTTGSQSARKDVRSTDPFVNQLEDLLHNAKSMQPVYDQTLPRELVDVHYNTTQELFALTMTPEAAAQSMEKKAEEIR